MSDHQDQVVLNEYAQQSFRDLADQDYIATRMAYCGQLGGPYRWGALQCMEKYLKAILLFNSLPIDKPSHDLRRLMERLEEIRDIRFEIPDDVRRFVAYVADFGIDRYLQRPTHVPMWGLLELDRAVWHIRRYCYYMRDIRGQPNGTGKSLLELQIARVHSRVYRESPHRYRVPGGYLEKQIDKRTEAARRLVWKNAFFGRRKRKRIRRFPAFSQSTNPFHWLNPESFSVLKEFVYFPNAVKILLEARMSNACRRTSAAQSTIFSGAQQSPLAPSTGEQ